MKSVLHVIEKTALGQTPMLLTVVPEAKVMSTRLTMLLDESVICLEPSTTQHNYFGFVRLQQ